MNATLNVRGQKIRTQTQRRWVVVAVRPTPIVIDRRTYSAFARIEKRTDNLDTARTIQRRYGRVWGAFVVVIDTLTGEEV